MCWRKATCQTPRCVFSQWLPSGPSQQDSVSHLFGSQRKTPFQSVFLSLLRHAQLFIGVQITKSTFPSPLPPLKVQIMDWDHTQLSIWPVTGLLTEIQFVREHSEIKNFRHGKNTINSQSTGKKFQISFVFCFVVMMVPTKSNKLTRASEYWF